MGTIFHTGNTNLKREFIGSKSNWQSKTMEEVHKGFFIANGATEIHHMDFSGNVKTISDSKIPGTIKIIFQFSDGKGILVRSGIFTSRPAIESKIKEKAIKNAKVTLRLNRISPFDVIGFKFK